MTSHTAVSSYAPQPLTTTTLTTQWSTSWASALALFSHAMLESKHPKDPMRAEERIHHLFKEALRIDTWHRPARPTMPTATPSSGLAASTAHTLCFDNHFLPYLEECIAVVFCRVQRPLLAH